MPNVVNMGQLGPARESDASKALGHVKDLSNIAIGLGGLAETSRSNQAQEAIDIEKNRITESLGNTNAAINQQEANTAVKNANLRQDELMRAKRNDVTERNKLSATLAKQDFDIAQKNRENTMEFVKQLSMKMNSMTPAERDAFKTSDPYKSSLKMVKSYAPEMYDADKGEIVTLNDADIYKAEWQKIATTNAQILANGGQLNPGQQAAQDLIDKVDMKIIAAAMEATAMDMNIDPRDPDAFGKALGLNIKRMIGGRTDLNAARQGMAPPDPNDPMGIFSGSDLSNGLGGL
jgi:hypothetical protein